MNIPLEGLKKTINRITASTKSTASQARKTIAKGKTKAQWESKEVTKEDQNSNNTETKEGQNNWKCSFKIHVRFEIALNSTPIYLLYPWEI